MLATTNVPVALAAQAQAIPYDTAVGASLWRAGLVLLALAGVMVAVRQGLRRWPRLTGQAATRRLQMVESLRLSPRMSLFLVEVDGKALLLGLQGRALQVLLSPEIHDRERLGHATSTESKT